MFIQLVSSFISKKPLEVIGVHCTHGFNRTGFLLVSYLVEQMDWSVEAALSELSELRLVFYLILGQKTHHPVKRRSPGFPFAGLVHIYVNCVGHSVMI